MTEDKWHHFTIINQSPYGYKAEVLMDGQLLKGVKSVNVFIDAQETNIVTLVIHAGSVNADVPAEEPK